MTRIMGAPRTPWCKLATLREHGNSTVIVCACGRRFMGTPVATRREYYAHQPNTEPIPISDNNGTWTPKTKAPDPGEIRILLADLETTRKTTRVRHDVAMRWEDSQISRCTQCGIWTWQGFCPVRACASNHTTNLKEAA